MMNIKGLLKAALECIFPTEGRNRRLRHIRTSGALRNPVVPSSIPRSSADLNVVRRSNVLPNSTPPRRIADTTAIRKAILTLRTSTPTGNGSGTLPVAMMRTITWIIPGSVGTSRAALDRNIAGGWREAIHSASGSADIPSP